LHNEKSNEREKKKEGVTGFNNNVKRNFREAIEGGFDLVEMTKEHHG